VDKFSLSLASELSESKQMKSKDALGIYGEELAARYLSKNGLVILGRNWRCDLGEIDVIAREKSDLVICEVKTRRTVAYGGRTTNHYAY
jgi:putative endonuclease